MRVRENFSNMSGKPLVVGVCGYKGSGKTHAASLIKKHFESRGLIVRRVAFADPLKRALSDIFSIDMNYFHDPSLKESVIPGLGVSPRKLMQAYGTEGVRDGMERSLLADEATPEWSPLRKGVWVASMQRRVEAESASEGGPDVWIIHDVRFADEARWISRDMGGFLLRVEAGSSAGGRDEHRSESVAVGEVDAVWRNSTRCETAGCALRGSRWPGSEVVTACPECGEATRGDSLTELLSMNITSRV